MLTDITRLHVTFGLADQEQRAWMCVDFILLDGVMIQNQDDTTFCLYRNCTPFLMDLLGLMCKILSA